MTAPSMANVSLTSAAVAAAGKQIEGKPFLFVRRFLLFLLLQIVCWLYLFSIIIHSSRQFLNWFRTVILNTLRPSLLHSVDFVVNVFGYIFRSDYDTVNFIQKWVVFSKRLVNIRVPLTTSVSDYLRHSLVSLSFHLIFHCSTPRSFLFPYKNLSPSALLKDQMQPTCSYTICHKSLPTPIWRPRSCHLVPSSRPRCSSTSRQIYRNALVLCRTTTTIRHKQPSKQCTVFKLAPRGWKSNWKNRKMPRSLIRSIHLSLLSIRSEQTYICTIHNHKMKGE